MSKSSYPKISIITPSYNSEVYIEHTIRSVLEQGYPNLEYIIIDGGSTDKTVQIIKKYESKLAFWISENDKGMYDAIQKGFQKSSGDIMGWIGSDDLYHANSLFTIAEIFTQNLKVNWLLGPSTIYDEDGKTVYTEKSKGFTLADFLTGDYKWIQQESCFWSRTLWEKAGSGLNTNLKYAGDFDLWIRFIQHEKLYITEALIGGFRKRRSGQLSLEEHDHYIEEVDFIIKRERKNYSRLFISKIWTIKFFESILRSLKVINTDFLLLKAFPKHRHKHFVKFSRKEQRFYSEN